MADGRGDPYQILGVERSASLDEIRRAFRRLAMEHHPDRNPHPGAEERFKEIAGAYETLSDPAKRGMYDRAGGSAARTSTGSTSSAQGAPPAAAASPIVVSGRGDGVKTISLHEGVWSCEVSVAHNSGPSGPDNFGVMLTGRNGGFALLANEIASNWQSREQVSVGRKGPGIRPGDIDVKVSASGDWSVSCVPQPSSSQTSGDGTASGHRSSSSQGASVGVSGRGVDVKTIDLREGIWFCDVRVAGNVDAGGDGDNFVVGLTSRNGGFQLLVNEIESDWSARKRVAVGGGMFDLGPGLIDVEVEASGRWAIDCALQPASSRSSTPPSSTVSLSGSGTDVQTINLSEGVWFCDVRVSGNVDGDDDEDHFSVSFTGRNGELDLLANEIVSDWFARRRISVGYGLGLFDFAPGLIDVEVEAKGQWAINCVLQ